LDGTAAFVNGDAITSSDVMINAIFLVRNPQWVAGRPRDVALKAAYQEALEQIVDQKLILQSYQQGAGRLPPWVIEKRISEIVDSRFDGDRTKLLQELSQQRITLDNWRKRIEEQTVVMAMRQSQIEGNIHIGPTQIQKYYDENPDEFIVEAATEVSLFYVAFKEGEEQKPLETLVDAAVDRLRNGEEFGVVARELDPAVKNDGHRGWIVPEDSFREDLAKRIASMPVGDVQSQKTEAGIFVVRKMGERSAGKRTLAEARSDIENTLFVAESQRLYKEWIARLRRNAKVEILEAF